MLPKTLNGWITVAVGLSTAVMTAYMLRITDAPPLWAVLVYAALGYLGLVMRGGGVELGKAVTPRAGVFLGLLLGAAALTSSGCPNTHAPALKAATALKRGLQSASTALAAGSTAELQAGQDKARICKRLRSYRDNIRPAARSSVAAVFVGVRIAREAGKDKIDYVAMLRPGGCAIMLGLRAWGHKLPDKGASILPLLELFQGVACSPQRKPEASAALAVLTAVLPAAVDLVKWIVQIVGAPVDALEKELSDWLQGQVADEVDAVITKWCHAPAGGT